MENIKTPKKLVDLFNEPKKDTLDEGKVINPKTNRLISKDGAVYKKLVKDGVIKGTDAKPPKTPKTPKLEKKLDVLKNYMETYEKKYKKKYPDGIPATKENIKELLKVYEYPSTNFYFLPDNQEKALNDEVDKLLRLDDPFGKRSKTERLDLINWYLIYTPEAENELREEKQKRILENTKKGKYEPAFVPPPKLGTKIGKGLNKDYLQQKFFGPHKDYIKGTKFYK